MTSELRYIGHTLSGHRHVLIANARLSKADGYYEREVRKVIVADDQLGARQGEVLTRGTYEGYDAAEFIQAMGELKIEAHVAQNTSGRLSSVPDAAASTVGHGICQ